MRLPDLVATLDEIRAGERGPTGRGGRTKREQRSSRREGRIDRHVSLKGRERTSAMRTSGDGNIGPPLLGGLCPRNMKGRSTSGIGKSMDGEREHRTRDMLEHIEKTDTGNDELAQAAATPKSQESDCADSTVERRRRIKMVAQDAECFDGDGRTLGSTRRGWYHF